MLDSGVFLWVMVTFSPCGRRFWLFFFDFLCICSEVSKSTLTKIMKLEFSIKLIFIKTTFGLYIDAFRCFLGIPFLVCRWSCDTQGSNGEEQESKIFDIQCLWGNKRDLFLKYSLTICYFLQKTCMEMLEKLFWAHFWGSPYRSNSTNTSLGAALHSGLL